MIKAGLGYVGVSIGGGRQVPGHRMAAVGHGRMIDAAPTGGSSRFAVLCLLV